MLKEKTYIVYHVVNQNRKVPIGELVERRRGERMGNMRDLLQLARKTYSSSTLAALEITVEPRREERPGE